MVKLANTPIIRFKKGNTSTKSFSFAELNSQTCKALSKMNVSRNLNKPHRIYGGGGANLL